MKKLTTTMMQQTLNKQDRRLTIGLDLGDMSSFYCVLDEAGEALLEQKVSTTPKAREHLVSAARRQSSQEANGFRLRINLCFWRLA
jgi:transposase